MTETPTDPVLGSERLILRRLRAEDVGVAYLGWLQDPDVNRFLEVRHHVPTMEQLVAYVRGLERDPRNVMFAIRLRPDRHVGNIKLGPIDRINMNAAIGLLIGEKQEWGKGLATEAIRLVTEFAFSTLGLHRVEAGCYSSNVGSRRAFERAGFAVEAVLPERYRVNGTWVGHVWLGRLRDT